MKLKLLFASALMTLSVFGAVFVPSIVPVATAADPAVELINPLGKTYDPRTIIGNIIKGVLGLIGSVALVLFIWGGLEIMLSRGDSGTIKKGQDTMIWAAIGLAVIFGSYAITSYIITAISKQGS